MNYNDILDFFEKFGIFIGGISALATVIITHHQRKKNKKEQFKSTLDSDIKIDDMLLKLEKELEAEGVKSIASLAIVTNGGKDFKFLSPVYIKALYCNSPEVLQLWGKDKTPLTKHMKVKIREATENGYSSLEVEDVTLKKVQSWAKVKHINNINYFLVGYKRSSTLILAINTEDKFPLNESPRLLGYTYASQLQEYANSGLKWYQEKYTNDNIYQ